MRQSIGSVSTGQMPDEEDWILFALGLAKSYVELVCGEPPGGCTLEVTWHDHDLGSYPSLGVASEWGSEEAGEYVERAEMALEKFDDSVQWSELKSYYHRSVENEADEEHEA